MGVIINRQGEYKNLVACVQMLGLWPRLIEGSWRELHMSYSLNSFKGGYIGDYIGDDFKGL